MPYIVGLDEAGRGCVIGPLVVCAYAIKKGIVGRLHNLGVKDSKLLSAGQRAKLCRILKRLGSAVVESVGAREITQAMRKKISLNEVEAMAMAKALASLCSSLRSEPLAIFVDSPDPSPKKFEQRLRKYVATRAGLVCENYADRRYAQVAAASIIAKVERDRAIEAIKRELGVDFGSGYSHDEATIAFLKAHLRDKRLEPYLRLEWETIKRLKRPRQTVLSEF